MKHTCERVNQLQERVFIAAFCIVVPIFESENKMSATDATSGFPFIRIFLRIQMESWRMQCTRVQHQSFAWMKNPFMGRRIITNFAERVSRDSVQIELFMMNKNRRLFLFNYLSIFLLKVNTEVYRSGTIQK